jgi:hypothetical protein
MKHSYGQRARSKRTARDVHSEVPAALMPERESSACTERILHGTQHMVALR